MRILRVAQTCYPDVTGGGAYHVHAMSRDQAAMGHDVTVLTVRRDPDSPYVEERDGYTLIRFDRTASLLGNHLSAGLARYLHRATDPDGASPDVDVVHAHSHLYASTNVAAFERWLGTFERWRGTGQSGRGLGFGRTAQREATSPLAITNHGLYSQTVPEWLFDGYLRTIGRWTFEQADVVFCYTAVERRRLRTLGVTTDVAVVPNGVDTERFSPAGPEHEGIGGHSPVDDPAVLFVGRLVDGKRPQDAIAAIEQVRETVPGATLYLCGEGPLRADLEAQADGIDDARDSFSATDSPDSSADSDDAGVVFLGHLDYDEMPRVYRAADVLVLPSRAEGMPRTVLEARASGTPVVASDLEHVQSLEDDGIRAVPVGDVDAIADEVLAVLACERPESTWRASGQPVSMGDGGRASMADGGGGPETAPHDGDSQSSNVVDHRDRTAHGWTETVRRTTDVLCDLCEDTP